MPPKNKSRNAPNQHDKRHESGLAPPGKRVVKKQSNGHLNGNIDGRSPVAAQLPTQPGTASAAPAGQRLAESPNVAPQVNLQDNATHADGAERDRTCSDASMDGGGGACADMADFPYDHAALSLGVEAQGPMFGQTAPIHGGSMLSTISTILSYYPLRDAISILILLLSLPPTLVLVIQTLFASLTFVPPTTSISLSTLPNIKEMFNSPNLGWPSLATILIVDLIFWVCWLPLWKPLQGVLLDLSQAVVAVSLSGAGASSGGPTYSIATTTAIVCIVHVLRYKAIHLTALDYLRSVIHKSNVGVVLDVSAFSTTYNSFAATERGWLYTVFRTILGIHIVSQGVTICVRRLLVKANEQSANVPAITRSDTEAAAGSDTASRTAGPHTGDAGQHGPVLTSADGRPPGPSSAARESRPRESTTKRKRKQANQVRSQQPLWAAIASTKVTFVKEMEQRDAADDSREAARMHTNTANNITTIPTTTPTTRVWICDVGDNEIIFAVRLAGMAVGNSSANLEEGVGPGAGIDKSKPFYVKINGATWSSTRIEADTADSERTDCQGERFIGEIFGLAPLSSYVCEIVSMAEQHTLCTLSIVTQPAPTPEQTAASSVPPQHQTLRPSSPITTLKQSIQNAESKLNDARSRTKKTKKDQHTKHSDLKKDVTSLRSKLDTSGGTDDKLEKRLLQFTQHKAQAEEVTAELKAEVDGMGDLPSDELTDSHVKRKEWQVASKAKGAVDVEFATVKASAEQGASSLKSEISQTESKRDKLATRNAQRGQELEKLFSKQEADMTAKQKRDFERAQVLHQREKDEKEIMAHIGSFQSEMDALNQKTHDAYQQIAALQSWSSVQPPPYPGYSSPPTPESSAFNATLGSPQSNGFPPFGPFQSPFHSAHPSNSNSNVQPSAPRGRSSSMLSQYSGFTDNGEEYSFAPQPPQSQYTWPVGLGAAPGALLSDDHKESEGSGSASLNNDSTGSNSPRPDARPFVPGKPPVSVGTIGPPSRAREKVPQSPGVIGSGR